MTYAFRCPKTGCVDFCESPGRHHCPFCDKMHMAYRCGAPEPEEGMPNVIGDKLAKHKDWAAGCVITSKSQRKRVYKKKRLRLTTGGRMV